MLRILNFDLSLGCPYVVRYSLMMLGRVCELSSQSAPRSQVEVINTLTTILFLPVQYSINYMRYATLYYKLGFVLDDFAQL